MKKTELNRFRAILEEKRDAVIRRARETMDQEMTLDTAEPVVPVPEHLASTRDALQRVLANLQEREPDGMNELPLQPPYQWDDSGWVANRWAELLPLPPELKHRLMVLDSPLLRLELISDLFDRMGVDR